jgi:UDP-glucose 4-epimerase
MSDYLVTGGAGFIGSHLVEDLLAAGHGVTVLDDLSTGKKENLPPQARLVRGSITDAALVKTLMARCDGCFHLAAIASVERCNNDWIDTHKVNMTGSITVLDAARVHKVPVVYASSAAVYGDAAALPIAEDAQIHPLSAYGADKRGVELHAMVAHSVHGVPSVGLRFFNVYGPRQNPHSPYSGVISIFAHRLAAGQRITISGDGTQTRDFVYVGDVVQALMRAMDYLPSPIWERVNIFNVCTGRETSLLQLADTLGQALHVKPQIAFGPARGGDIKRSVGDPSLLEERLGFRPHTGLAQGLETMLSYERSAHHFPPARRAGRG